METYINLPSERHQVRTLLAKTLLLTYKSFSKSLTKASEELWPTPHRCFPTVVIIDLCFRSSTRERLRRTTVLIFTHHHFSSFPDSKIWIWSEKQSNSSNFGTSILVQCFYNSEIPFASKEFEPSQCDGVRGMQRVVGSFKITRTVLGLLWFSDSSRRH